MVGKMNKRMKKKWVTALRSGEYEQGKDHLVTVDQDGTERFCCLGVLCNLSTEAGYGEWSEMNGVPEFQGETGVFPRDVADKYGLTCFGEIPGDAVIYKGRSHPTLVSLNDAGAPFSFIDDVIEERF
jgi:hypothetical protein